MAMTDPVADYLTRIRNGQSRLKDYVDIPCSNLKKRISFILKEEYFVRDYIEIKDNKQNMLRVFLKYDSDNNPVINGIKRVSKPGLRIYRSKDALPKVIGGLGVAIISTSAGLMTDREARTKGIGGEVVCAVY